MMVKNLIKIMNAFFLQDPKKKFFKRGDLAAKQTEEYWKKHSNQIRPQYSTQVKAKNHLSFYKHKSSIFNY